VIRLYLREYYVGKKKLAGYIFITYKGDHRPFHVHITKNNRELGRWDIENQKPMDNFEIPGDLKDALIKLGYMLGGEK
jgi:hypothetical protein